MEITANTAQTVAAGSNVLFTDTPVGGCCSILHRAGSGLVTLRGLTRSQVRARFRILFSGNIAIPTGGAVGSISLAIATNGEPVATSTMISTPTATNNYNNVSSSLYLEVPAGCCTQISVENSSTQAISVENANLIVERVA